MSSGYEVRRKITGGYAVYYACPKCSEQLVSSLNEAGSQQVCPNCSRPYVVPGQKEAIELQMKQAEAKAARDKAQADAKAEADAEAAKQAALDKQRLQAAEVKRQKELVTQRNRLYATRREVALAPAKVKSSFGVQLVCVVLALAGAINLLVAVITALTIVGLPIAAGLLFAAALCFGAGELLHYVQSIYSEIAITREHLQFQSSVLDGIYEELRRG